jgi:hypothetical protein
MSHLIFRFAILFTIAAALPAHGAEGQITIQARVLDTQAGAGAACAAEEAIGDGPAAQLLSDGLVQVRREVGMVGVESGATSERITIEFVAN